MVFESIENLIVCKCDYTVADLHLISTMFPNLTNLNLSGNGIEQIKPDFALPSTLQFLDLSNNPIGRWCDLVQLLRPLSRLKELNVTNCAITDLTSKGVVLPSVLIIVLSENPITSLEAFNYLNETGMDENRISGPVFTCPNSSLIL